MYLITKKYSLVLPILLMVFLFTSCHKGGEPIPYNSQDDVAVNNESESTLRINDKSFGEDTEDDPSDVSTEETKEDGGVVGGDDNEDDDDNVTVTVDKPVINKDDTDHDPNTEPNNEGE